MRWRLLVLGAALAACAKGDKLGVLDLQTKDAAFVVDAAAGDTLHFRLDITVTAPTLAGQQSRDAKSPIFDAMKRSRIDLVVKDDTGAAQTTSCEAFNRGALVQSQSGNEMSKTAMPLDCTLELKKAGKHTLGGSVAWDPLLVATEAKLEVRLAKK